MPISIADGDVRKISTDRLSLGVVPGLGAGLAWLRSIEDGAVTWRWLRETSAEPASVPSELGCFLLVPFSNRIADARFQVGGRDVRLPVNFAPEPHMIHGVGWRSVWHVAECTRSHMTLTLDWDGEDWPWRFSASVTYVLLDDGLTATLHVRNDDTSPMPSGLGFHPYFPRRPDVRLNLDAEAVVLNDDAMVPQQLSRTHDALTVLRAGDPLPDGLDNGLKGWTGSAAITWPDQAKQLQIETSPPSNWAILFTPSNQDWFCFEPVTHQTNAHNGPLPGVADTGLRHLAPGESQAFEMRLTLSDAVPAARPV